MFTIDGLSPNARMLSGALERRVGTQMLVAVRVCLCVCVRACAGAGAGVCGCMRVYAGVSACVG